MAERIATPTHPNFKDLTGTVTNGVTALRVVGKRGSTYYWRFLCHCGKEFEAMGSFVSTGRQRSCGCLKAAALRRQVEKNTTHGGTDTREFWIWMNMKARCADPSHKSHAAYGGRGIAVCERWLNDFAAFRADMGPRPSLRHTLERIDNARGYSPGNCRWATAKEQANNRRDNRLLTFEGRTLTVARWGNELGIIPDTILKRLRRGWSVERALGTPIGRWHRG